MNRPTSLNILDRDFSPIIIIISIAVLSRVEVSGRLQKIGWETQNNPSVRSEVKIPKFSRGAIDEGTTKKLEAKVCWFNKMNKNGMFILVSMLALNF